MINPLWLRTFCTLVESGHFTRTAEQLHMTQSGVSQQIRKLEQQLGAELLIREGKQFTLSDAGQRLYSEALSVLQSLSELEQSVAEDDPHSGLVRVFSPGSVGLKLYPQLLSLQEKHPDLVIDHRFAPNVDVENAIADAKADVGSMTSKSNLAEVTTEAIAEEPLLLVMPSGIDGDGGDVNEKSRVVNDTPEWAVLESLGFIDHPDAAHHANLLLSANYPQFEHSDAFTKRGGSNQIGLILEPVSCGLGFTVLPAHAVAAFPKPELIRAYRLATPVSETLYLCHRRHKTLAKRVQTVIAEARRCLSS